MKWKTYAPPVALLLALLLLCLWNSHTITAQTEGLARQLRQADMMLQFQRWPDTRRALAGSYNDWSSQQTYLHIVVAHDAVDHVQALYRRAEAFAETENSAELRAELAELQEALRLLAEMEQFSLKNTL